MRSGVPDQGRAPLLGKGSNALHTFAPAASTGNMVKKRPSRPCSYEPIEFMEALELVERLKFPRQRPLLVRLVFPPQLLLRTVMRPLAHLPLD